MNHTTLMSIGFKQKFDFATVVFCQSPTRAKIHDDAPANPQRTHPVGPGFRKITLICTLGVKFLPLRFNQSGSVHRRLNLISM